MMIGEEQEGSGITFIGNYCTLLCSSAHVSNFAFRSAESSEQRVLFGFHSACLRLVIMNNEWFSAARPASPTNLNSHSFDLDLAIRPCHVRLKSRTDARIIWNIIVIKFVLLLILAN